MSDIDLIPTDYRRRLARLRQLKAHAVASLLIVALGAGAYAGLVYANRQLRGEVTRLQQAKAITEQQRAELEKLHAEQEHLSEQARLQAGLSGGLTAQRMFLVVDRALQGEEVWFTRWTFERSGKPMDQPAEPVSTGYILVIPQDQAQNPSSAKAWRIDTQMSIQGQAVNHEALAAFVGRLIAQPEVETAHLLEANVVPGKDNGMVEFELSVRINMAMPS